MSNIGATNLPNHYKSWAISQKATIMNSFKKGKDYRQGIIYMEQTENVEDRLTELQGMDNFEVWADGQRASQTELKEGYRQTFTQINYGKELPIGRLAKKFQMNDARALKIATKQFGKNAYRIQQKAPFSMLGYGFSDTNTYLTGLNGETVNAKGPDGKRLFSIAHPNSPDDSTNTWSNALLDGAEVGEDALKDMIDNLDVQTDSKNEKKHWGEEGYIWAVPLQQLAEAKRVCGSELRSSVSDNDVNVYKGSFDSRPIEVRYIPWLGDFGSTENHYLIAKDAIDEMPLNCFTATPFYTDEYEDKITKTAYVRGELGFAVGILSGRGMVGSLGDGVTVVA